MGRISMRSVVLGGLLAGVILNAGEILFHWSILGGDWWFFKALSRPIQEAGGIVHYLGLYFLTGIAAIWLYAVARPRFGPGPKTAVYTALGYWVIGDALPTLSWAPLLASHPWLQGPLFTARRWVIAALVELALTILATAVGAWVYEE